MESRNEVCANCKWHKKDGSAWICMNEVSDNWGYETEDEESCVDWESRD